MVYSPLTPSQRHRLWLRLAVRMGLLGLAVGSCLWLLPPLVTLFAPFVCALLAAAALNPIVRILQRKLGWGRGIFTLLVLGGVVAGLGGGITAIFYVAVGELSDLLLSWETVLFHMTQVLEKMDTLLESLWRAVPPALLAGMDALYGQMIQWLQDIAPKLVERMAGGAGQLVGKVPHFLLGFLVFVLATYFLTADYPYLRTRIIGRLDDGVLLFFKDVRQTALAAFGGYLRAQLFLSVGVFFILLAGFFLTRQPYGVLIAAGLAVLDFIPILGAGTVMVPWAFVALFSGEGNSGMEIMIIWGIVALFRRIAEPKFVGNQTGLSPIASLCSIYAGLQLAGVWGMILGPILALILVNLAGLGVFRGLVEDWAAAARDVANFLKRS